MLNQLLNFQMLHPICRKLTGIIQISYEKDGENYSRIELLGKKWIVKASGCLGIIYPIRVQ
jgi:hypothetical protein